MQGKKKDSGSRVGCHLFYRSWIFSFLLILSIIYFILTIHVHFVFFCMGWSHMYIIVRNLKVCRNLTRLESLLKANENQSTYMAMAREQMTSKNISFIVQRLSTFSSLATSSSVWEFTIAACTSHDKQLFFIQAKTSL